VDCRRPGLLRRPGGAACRSVLLLEPACGVYFSVVVAARARAPCACARAPGRFLSAASREWQHRTPSSSTRVRAREPPARRKSGGSVLLSSS
jgi:hypothetical protein